MKNKEVKGILALVVVTALSFGVIIGSKSLALSTGTDASGENSETMEEFDVSGAENIEKAGKTADGYLVTVRTKGYVGDIVMDVAFDSSASKITDVQVVEQSETDGLGSKITEPEFLDQFKGAEAPVFLPGMDVSADSENSSSETESAKQETDLTSLEGAELADGTYEAKTSGPDSNGFIDVVSLTVKDGAITEANWDAVTEDGSKKSIMSENGEYTMTENGPTWKEQAEALAEALIENQSLAFLTTDAEGKTDAVTGVSISVNGFIDLATQCLEQASGIKAAEPEATEAPAEEEAPAAGEGTQIDAVSGATMSSTAAVNGINDAYNFLQTVK